MLKQVLENLKENEIISERNVEDFRCYIRNKNPHASKPLLSSILADALHRALDTKLEQFAHEDRGRIRDKVIRSAAEKERFSVNGAEVFHACMALKDTGEAFRESLTQWVCLNQALEVDRLWIEHVMNQLKQQDELHLDQNVEEPVPEKSTYFPGKAGTDTRTYSSDLTVDAEALKKLSGGKRNAIRYALLAVLTTAAAVCFLFTAAAFIFPKQLAEAQIVETAVEQPDKSADGIGYVEVEEALLKGWLGRKDSLLAEEPYFSSILSVSKRYDIHPLLMFAITGQEQAFVPESNKNSKKMANNPFNVCGSWQKYNTDIRDSAELAAGLIANSTKSKPAEENIIRWINKKYAEDPEWWINVTLIFDKMKREIMPQ